MARASGCATVTGVADAQPHGAAGTVARVATRPRPLRSRPLRDHAQGDMHAWSAWSAVTSLVFTNVLLACAVASSTKQTWDCGDATGGLPVLRRTTKLAWFFSYADSCTFLVRILTQKLGYGHGAAPQFRRL